MPGDFEDIETTTAEKTGVCFDCGEDIFAGATIVTAFYRPAGTIVAFHELCWSEEKEGPEPKESD